MAYEFKLPDLGEGLTEGEISRWLVSVGDEVAEDQPLVEIQTDKTTVEIPSPAAGKVTQILVEEGAVVPVGTLLVVIGGDGAPPVVEKPKPEAPAPKGKATPLVRKIAQELGVDLESLDGTGPQGRITEQDVRSAASPQEGRLKPLVATALKACAESLQEFPELNARLEGDEIVYLDRYDLGVAVQTKQGLVVPVVRGCDTASLDELDAELRR